MSCLLVKSKYYQKGENMESFAHQTKQKIFAKKLGANCCRNAFFFGLCMALLQKKEELYRIVLPLEEMKDSVVKLIHGSLKKDCKPIQIQKQNEPSFCLTGNRSNNF